MKNKFSFFIGVFGWLLFIAYLAYDYNEHKQNLFQHLLSTNSFSEYFLHFLILITPLGSTLTAYMINDRKKLLDKTQRSEKHLEHAANEWKTTFDSMPYGVMLIDNEYKIVRTNKYISDLYKIPIKELISQKCYQALHKKGSPVEDCPLEKSIKTQKAETYEYFNSVFNKYLKITVTPVFGEGRDPIAFVHLIIDNTEVKQQENKLIDSRNAFFNMLKDTDNAHNELKELHQDLIIAFANAIDAKSHWTEGHSIGVARYAVTIAKEMGINETEIDVLNTAALLHDIGKIGTFDGILDKKGTLTEEEYGQIMKHPVQGEKILKPIKGLNNVVSIIRSHHEKVDGKGYPDNLTGEKIPLLSKILCVADSFDSMVSERPYRPSVSKKDAISEIKRCSGTQFDPKVVETLLNLVEKEKI
ncbi:MAG: HD-GYP domain-containing protein [bacterium]|nr:HD-GYP domain-containing protein [bacterium]